VSPDLFRQPPVGRVAARNDHPLDAGAWPRTVPAVDQLLRDGLTLAPGVTFLVGENGSGKSTIVDALAVAYGLSPEGGTAHGQHSTRATESPLSDALTLMRTLDDLARSGGQILCATHSPVLAALPGATILEVGPWGLRPARWEDLELVGHRRSYLADPARYLRHLLDD